jgi:hypothetical protein
MKKTEKSDLNLKDVVLNIAYEASKKGNSALSNALIDNISKFNSRNTQISLHEDVEEISCVSKEQAKNFIYIETDTAVWFDLEKEVLLELSNDGKLISCGFSLPTFPFDLKMKEIEKIGITTDISPYGFPSNILGDTVVLYHGCRLDDNIVPSAILIDSKLGKKLSNILSEDLIYRKEHINNHYSNMIKQFMNKMSLLQYQKYRSLYKEILKLGCFKPEETLIFAMAISCDTTENRMTTFSKKQIIELTNLNECSINSCISQFIENGCISQKFSKNDDIYLIKDIAKKQLIPRVVLSMLNDYNVRSRFPEIEELLISNGLNLSIKPLRTGIEMPI